MKSTDGTKVGRTARNMYKEFKTILGNWCGKKKKISTGNTLLSLRHV